MEIKDNRIDAGKAFDWGKTSEYYARYRDIYPDEFYQRVADRGLCVKGQRVLDLGTGTGVLPRNMYKYGADWIGTVQCTRPRLRRQLPRSPQGHRLGHGQ